MRSSFFLFLLAAAACGGSSSEGSTAGDGSIAPPPGAPGAPGARPPGQTPAGAASPGAIDPACAESGFVAIANASVQQILATPPNAVLSVSTGLFDADAAGKLTPIATGMGGWLVPIPTGGFYSVPTSQSTSAVDVLRLGADFKSDSSYAFDTAKWTGQSFLAAAGADGSLYAAGSVALDTTEAHVIVRHFLANGKIDAAFATADDQSPKDRTARAIVVAKDGGIVVEADDGFTPALLRFTPAGALDTSFGDQGDLVLDALGPRYGRALLVDDQGRILVLGMTNDDVQIARVLANGTLDAAFGSGGIATVTIPTKNESDSSSLVDVEARAMFLDGSGRILVSADESTTPEGKIDPSSGFIHLARLDASGKPDASFGTGGVATIDFGGGALVTRNLSGGGAFAPLGDGHLLVGGQKIVPNGSARTMQWAVACVKM